MGQEAVSFAFGFTQDMKQCCISPLGRVERDVSGSCDEVGGPKSDSA
jgi:hypothetical protein